MHTELCTAAKMLRNNNQSGLRFSFPQPFKYFKFQFVAPEKIPSIFYVSSTVQ